MSSENAIIYIWEHSAYVTCLTCATYKCLFLFYKFISTHSASEEKLQSYAFHDKIAASKWPLVSQVDYTRSRTTVFIHVTWGQPGGLFQS